MGAGLVGAAVVLALCVGAAGGLLSASAQATQAPATTSAPASPDDPAASADLAVRRDLAARMHRIRPAREQIDAAIEQVARSGVPEPERQGFILSMQRIIDYKALEVASVEAMAETFTAQELQSMVEYYEKPEARSASDKFADYQKKIEPLVYQMLDRAMMRMRTGSAPGSAR